ncbi:hypothetical protein AA313_de0201672 [Arthrobotrys entomopaga]|nr:hypothetical protein AA313_de0201672 [Arthrobotrys entomopaga]
MFWNRNRVRTEKAQAQPIQSAPARSRYQNILREVRIFFGIMLILSLLELGFTIDSYIWLEKNNKWWSGSEKARFCFLIFSCVRTIVLSALYTAWHRAQKMIHSLLHAIFLFLSTVFWVVSGVLIHHMWGYKECGGVGPLKGGLNECHEIKIIEILAWIIAAVSVVGSIPVVMIALENHRNKKQAGGRHHHHHGRHHGLGSEKV